MCLDFQCIYLCMSCWCWILQYLNISTLVHTHTEQMPNTQLPFRWSRTGCNVRRQKKTYPFEIETIIERKKAASDSRKQELFILYPCPFYELHKHWELSLWIASVVVRISNDSSSDILENTATFTWMFVKNLDYAVIFVQQYGVRKVLPLNCTCISQTNLHFDGNVYNFEKCVEFVMCSSMVSHRNAAFLPSSPWVCLLCLLRNECRSFIMHIHVLCTLVRIMSV